MKKFVKLKGDLYSALLGVIKFSRFLTASSVAIAVLGEAVLLIVGTLSRL